mmetsp:Transcript_6652/g.11192  ORF Transcript_6652/g.11192 Transcript_6652/m.11192 type:complete len:209 (+) Transcript_6652:1575-2201(+)
MMKLQKSKKKNNSSSPNSKMTNGRIEDRSSDNYLQVVQSTQTNQANERSDSRASRGNWQRAMKALSPLSNRVESLDKDQASQMVTTSMNLNQILDTQTSNSSSNSGEREHENRDVLHYTVVVTDYKKSPFEVYYLLELQFLTIELYRRIVSEVIRCLRINGFRKQANTLLQLVDLETIGFNDNYLRDLESQAAAKAPNAASSMVEDHK